MNYKKNYKEKVKKHASYSSKRTAAIDKLCSSRVFSKTEVKQSLCGPYLKHTAVTDALCALRVFSKTEVKQIVCGPYLKHTAVTDALCSSRVFTRAYLLAQSKMWITESLPPDARNPVGRCALRYE